MKLAQLGIATLLITLASAATAGPAEDFSALLDEVWEWQLAENPMFASQLGDKRYNDRWSDQSLAAIERRQEETRAFLRRVYAIDRIRIERGRATQLRAIPPTAAGRGRPVQIQRPFAALSTNVAVCKTSTTTPTA